MTTNEIIVIMGFQGVGKDTVAREIEKQGYNFIVSTSTRPMRDGESQNNPYNFIDNEEFELLIKNNGLIEYRKYETIQNGSPAVWYYGIEWDKIEEHKKYVVVLDPSGSKQLKDAVGSRVKIFYIHVDDKTSRERAKLRGGYEEAEFNRRYEDDKKRFTSEIIEDIADFSVKNYDLNECINSIFREIK